MKKHANHLLNVMEEYSLILQGIITDDAIIYDNASIHVTHHQNKEASKLIKMFPTILEYFDFSDDDLSKDTCLIDVALKSNNYSILEQIIPLMTEIKPETVINLYKTVITNNSEEIKPELCKMIIESYNNTESLKKENKPKKISLALN